MILVDSSVWIDFFGASPGAAGRELRRLIAERAPVVLTGVVLAEVLQGLSRNAEEIEQYLVRWDLVEPRGAETYCQVARMIRLARAAGITLHTIHAIIAAIALEHGAAVFSLGTDFAHIARMTPLSLYRPPQ